MAGRPKGSLGKKKVDKGNKGFRNKFHKSAPKKAAVVPAVVNDVADEDATDWDAVPTGSDSESEEEEVESEEEAVESEEEAVDVMDHLVDEDYDPVNKVLYNRMSIAGAFGKFHGYQPDGWHGKEGIIIQIRKRLELGRWIDIESILTEVLRCKMDRTQYTGALRPRGGRTNGRPPIIALDSEEAQIIADCIEDGLSPGSTTQAVNQRWEDADQDALTNSAVATCVRNVKPKMVPVQKLKQGSHDQESAWARARLRWVTQLSMVFGETKPGEVRDHLIELGLMAEGGATPACFDPEQLTLVDRNKTVWWDETHRKCKIGKGTGRKYQVQFRRNKDGSGKLDPDGDYSEERLSFLKVKFEDEVRLCLGAGTVVENGAIVGKRAHPFDYSGKTIITIKDRATKRRQAIFQAKQPEKPRDPNNPNEKPRMGVWRVDPRVDREIFVDDGVQRITNLGKVAEDKLKAHGIVTVQHLRDMTDEKIEEIQVPRSLTVKKLKQFRAESQERCIDSPAPEIIDHRKAENPFLSRYGEDEWEARIDATTPLCNYICVTDMVEHIVSESRALVNEGDDFFFYHDALKLMTAHDTIAWMKEKGYYKHWILPQLGLQHDQPGLKRFQDAPVGDSPEMMPWDNSMNQDVHLSVVSHVTLTANQKEDTDAKFSLSTPARGSHAYKRIIHPTTGNVPCGTRIVRDVAKVFESIVKIKAVKGAVVYGLGDRNGRGRQHNQGYKRGGHRPRKRGFREYRVEDRWIHPDARGELEVKIEIAKKKHKGKAVVDC